MTQDERNMLQDLANKITQTPAPPKDPEAEDFIRTKIGSRPDALYIMTQTVLIQNLALQHAQQQINDLQQRAGSPQIGAGGGSFLGQSAPPPRSGSAPGPQYSAPPPQYAAPGPQYTAGQQPAGLGAGAGGFLRGAAQTAAGVAAGGLAFEAISSLFHHGGGGFGGFGGGWGGGGFAGAPVDETVVNNYYDEPRDDAANYGDNQQYDDANYGSGDDGGGGFGGDGDGDGDSGDNFS